MLLLFSGSFLSIIFGLCLYQWVGNRYAKSAPSLWLFLFPYHGVARSVLGVSNVGAHLYVMQRHMDAGVELRRAFINFMQGTRLSVLDTYESQLLYAHWESLGGSQVMRDAQGQQIQRLYDIFAKPYLPAFLRVLQHVQTLHPDLFEKHFDHRYEFIYRTIVTQYKNASMHERLQWGIWPQFTYVPVELST